MTRSRLATWMRPFGDDPTPWLLEAGAPWVRLGVLRDLLDAPPDDPAVVAAREALAAHPLVGECRTALAGWPEPPLRRHDDAKHPLHRLKLLVDLGVDGTMLPEAPRLVGRILAQAGPDAQLRSVVCDPETQEPQRLAFPCDSPLLLGAVLALGDPAAPRVAAALEALEVRREQDGGWFCHGEWHGLETGWRQRPESCPIATLYSLWALARLPAGDPRRSSRGAELLLGHFEAYERRAGHPICFFQAGKRFRRLKFPFVWYDVLHVLDVLTRFEELRGDRRLRAMVDAALPETPRGGRVKAGSAFTAYKAFDFGQKREPSPTITFLLARVLRRLDG
jgi:hypothetical protein